MAQAQRVAIVTGAARGLGAGYAQTLAQAGYAVTITDLRDCAATREAIAAAGGRVLALHTDVTSAAETQAMAAATVAEFGRIDVLVNNAGAFSNLTNSRFENIREEEWELAFAVNVKGPWQCAKAVVPHLRSAGGGSIINISSMASVFGRAFFLHYGASKGALIGLTRALARELGRDNIRVNAIAPVMTDTPGMRETVGEHFSELAEATIKNQCLRKTLEVSDQVGTVLYLAGDLSRFVTGQTLMVDGGTVFL